MPALADPRLELAARDALGVRVQLLWDPDDDGLAVRVVDLRTEDRREFAVEPEDALDAFRRPFAFAHAG